MWVDVLGGEASGRDQRQSLGMWVQALCLFLTYQVDVHVVVHERLHVHGQLALSRGAEPDIHGTERRANSFDQEVGQLMQERRPDGVVWQKETIGRLEVDHRQTPCSLHVAGRHEHLDIVGALGLSRQGGRAHLRKVL
jgi:hypothetical protein